MGGSSQRRLGIAPGAAFAAGFATAAALAFALHRRESGTAW
ncbi:hypothetical protein ACIPWI_06775 [Streptomyces sp. NPDC090046]